MTPSGWKVVGLSEVITLEEKNLNLERLASMGTVALYSLPSYDAAQQPEIVDATSIQSGKRHVPADCVLLAKLNPRIPRVWRVKHEGALPAVSSTEFWPLTARTSDIDLDFLSYMLRSPQFLDHPLIKPASSTNSHQRIDRESFLRFPLLVPPLPEQKKIADILGSVDDAILATQAVIEQTRKVKQGLLRELVSQHMPTSGTDEQCLVRLSEVATKITDGDHKTPIRSNSGFPLLGARNVQNGKLDLSVLDYVGEAEYARMIKRCHPEPDDILLSCSGTIGRVCQVPLDLKVALVRSVALVKPDTMKCRARFLYWTLQSPQLQEQMALGQKKLAQANLFQSAISNLVLPLPSLADQDEICRILDAVLAHENATVEHLYLLKTLKIGLMADLLTGRKRVEVSA